MSELYYDRIVIIPIFLLPFVLLLNGIITSWYYYRMFVIRNSTITKYIQYRMNYYWMTPLPISTITKVFHPRIVPIPNATITELRITELFYYGLLLPNVAHSANIHFQNYSPHQRNIQKCSRTFLSFLLPREMLKCLNLNAFRMFFTLTLTQVSFPII